MSRSFKKEPVLKIINKTNKRKANKKVRRYNKDISNGSYYKKIYSSYDIIDYSIRFTKDEYVNFECELHGEDKRTKFEHEWFKQFKMK